MDLDEAYARLLDAAEELFYARGVQAVGMDELRSVSGVSLKRAYQCFASKEALVEACLRRRDERWRGELRSYVSENARSPAKAPLAVFDWLHDWFSEPGFRGCAFLNSLGELGPSSAPVAEAVRDHKRELRRYLRGLTRELPVHPAAANTLAEQLLLLMDGATATAASGGGPAAARDARAAAGTLLDAALTAPGTRAPVMGNSRTENARSRSEARRAARSRT
ncbi:TetR/AcrR family transcriptional regulator [Streptomyces sp. ODS28]|uniref:TetR/AcrR family transcriptional regulator n=1 Tax=Streptomyces sp. ODS28 TaxID=3136688 RepID=UPI0031F1938B